jgi:hypothetical protein
LFVDRVLPGPLPLEAYAQGEFAALASWGRSPLNAAVQRSADFVEVVCRPVGTEGGEGLIEKRLRFTAAGALSVAYTWDPAAFPAGALFAPEISLSRPLEIHAPAADVWSFPIATVSKSDAVWTRQCKGNR